MSKDNESMTDTAKIFRETWKPPHAPVAARHRTKRIYHTAQVVIARSGGARALVQIAFRIFCREGLSGVKKRLSALLGISGIFFRPRAWGSEMGLHPIPCPTSISDSPKVSIIVPNYNHNQYLRARLDSIYNQSYKNFEVILLDDCSQDQSRETLQEYADKYKSQTIFCPNETNSGGVFNQWEKGLNLAKGELIWIAESDDYCEANFLQELVRFFSNQAVMLAYCRTDFVKGEPPAQCWTIEEYLSGPNLEGWQAGKPFIRSAHWLVNNIWGLRNIVPNVSSAIFRHPGSLKDLAPEDWTKLKLCGDWIFYLAIVRGGLVAYSPLTTNYYRQHDQSTSFNVQKTDSYYIEFETVVCVLLALYHIEDGLLERQREHLYDHWVRHRGTESREQFDTLYNLARARQRAKKRKPNLLMAAYALTSGGGETFPIFLANMLRQQGYGITFFNNKCEVTDPLVRKMLDSHIPLLEINDCDLIESTFKDMGIEAIHSHHLDVDVGFSYLLSHSPEIRRVVTMHGMYEMLSDEQFSHLLPILDKTIDHFVYAAEKNIAPFSESFRRKKSFVKINNALAMGRGNPVSRIDLGIDRDAFVLCMVARAIPDKGWQEAIEAVTWAHQHAKRDIHLLMIGEGTEYTRLKQNGVPAYIHLLGFQADVRGYFAACDMGFIPSRFRGESFPLVLIDCLHAGKPVLASNIGEIPHMLHTPDGIAGELINLENWNIPIEALGRRIVALAEDTPYFESLCQRVTAAAAKFDPKLMIEEYDRVYQEPNDGTSDDISDVA